MATTRRDAVKSVVGLGLAASAMLSASTVTRAQDDGTPTPMVDHPVVGVWRMISTAGTLSIHPDGSYMEANPYGAGVGIGSWRPTGERSAEVVIQFPDAYREDFAALPKTMMIWWYPEVDEDGGRISGPFDSEFEGVIGSGYVSGSPLTLESTPRPEPET